MISDYEFQEYDLLSIVYNLLFLSFLMSKCVSEYLTVYNIIEAILWLLGLCEMSFHVQPSLLIKYYIIIQSIMLLDPIHIIFGFVTSKLLTTMLEIASRIYVAWIILPSLVVSNFYCNMMFFAWSMAEIIRYSFYVCKKNKYLLLARYNAFIILYPMGVLGELVSIYNHSVETSTLLKLLDYVVISLYIPAFPLIFGHMMKLRSKELKELE